MTDKKTLKQRVRERQEKTGERYTTALAQVRAQAASPVQAESHDVTRAAQREGLACGAFASDALWRAECSLGAPEERFRGVFARLRALLEASAPGEPGEAVARLLARGERTELQSAVQELASARQFLASARAGVRGVSANGRLLAFDVPRGDLHAPVLAVVLASPFPRDGRLPLLWLSALSERDDALGGHLALAGLGGPRAAP